MLMKYTYDSGGTVATTLDLLVTLLIRLQRGDLDALRPCTTPARMAVCAERGPQTADRGSQTKRADNTAHSCCQVDGVALSGAGQRIAGNACARRYRIVINIS